MEINIAKYTGPAFDELFFDILEHRHTHYWLKGGRGSLKSSFISLVIPALLLMNPGIHGVIFRKIERDIKRSVFPQIQWGITTLGLAEYFRVLRSPFEITYLPTGQKLLFFGLDDPAKVKSIKLPFGYIGLVWLEELDQFRGMEEIRNLNQSLLRGGEKFWEFCSFNPPKSRDNWVNEEQLIEYPDRLISHTTYLDAPKDWLGSQFLMEAEKLKAKNEVAYRHEYLGEVTGTGGAVFENVVDIALTEEQISQMDRLYYGLDFGFSMDPLAFVAMYYDKKREDLFIIKEIYGQKMSNKEAARRIAPIAGNRRIIADSAEPKSIAEMKEYGLFMEGAKKGPDSVDYGIRWLQNLAHIYIDKRRCPNVYREFVCYEYERNREGAFISAYPDKNNHTIDAVRYGCWPLMRTETFRF